MIKKLRIDGLDCAHCASKLEDQIKKIKIVENAKIDFARSQMVIESDNIDLAIEEAKALIKKLEPNARVDYSRERKLKFNFLINLGLLILGAVIGGMALILDVGKMFWFMFVASALLMGYGTYIKAIKLLISGVINENLLITISVIGAGALGKFMESLMVICLYSIGKILESLAINRSKKSIEELTKLSDDYAIKLVDEKEVKVEPKELKVNDIIMVRPGERVAIDGIVQEGSSNLNLQSLTGESLPVCVKEGDKVLSGSIVLDGLIKIKATSNYSESTVSRIMSLIENASQNKSRTETIISKISKWYTLGVIVGSIVIFGVIWAVLNNIDIAIYRALTFLVVSCPCAFAISVPLAYFSGLGNASKNGILIKGSNYLDGCAKLDVVVFDKTGTLSTGEFEVDRVNVFLEGKTEADIIYLASLGEQYSLHPLAKSIVQANSKKLGKLKEVEEIAGKGVRFKFNGKTYFVGKKSKILANTSVELFENDKKIGEIILKDRIKESSFNAIKSLRQMGIKVIMLSGDSKEVAEKVASELGIDEFYSEMLPEAKYKIIEGIIKSGKRVGYVGDGINDAPSLMISDVGFSMGINGTDASIEASDIVLVDDNPEKTSLSIKLSRYTRRIVWQNIIFAFGVKLTFLMLGAFGVTGMLSAVIGDVGVTVLAILNSLRALRKNF